MVLLVHGFPESWWSWRHQLPAWPTDAIAAFPTTLPGLLSFHLPNGCGHWIQQQRPAEVNRLLGEWLALLRH